MTKNKQRNVKAAKSKDSLHIVEQQNNSNDNNYIFVIRNKDKDQKTIEKRF